MGRSLSRRCRALTAFLAIAPLIATAACSIPRWPVRGPITSAYGLRMRGLRPEIHRGVDVYVPEGTPVMTMKAGEVVYAGSWGSYGLTVVIGHGGSLRTLYAHLSAIEVTTGTRVEDRQVIGRSGRTGNATGPHLHFEILRGGWAEDPVPLLGGSPGETPVPDQP